MAFHGFSTTYPPLLPPAAALVVPPFFSDGFAATLDVRLPSYVLSVGLKKQKLRTTRSCLVKACGWLDAVAHKAPA